jgi:hypothetical protein
MPTRFSTVVLFFLLAVAACGDVSTAITVKIDYTKDASGFFGASNPQGPTGAAQAKASIEAAAAFYSEVLEDTFSTFEIPETFYGSQGGQVKWFWKQRVINPSTGLNEAELNATPPVANEFVVYVGARSLIGADVAEAGPGGFVGGFPSKSGSFTAAENAQIAATAAEFLNGTKRGQSSGFSSWGGSATFDSGSDVSWHFNRTTSPAGGTTDFYSVALHELGHVLGLGTSADWNKLVVGTGFTGANSLVQHPGNGNVPLASVDDKGHWQQGIETSSIYEGAGTQLPIMVPTLLLTQVRRQLTNLDAAALADIGWQIDLPGGSASAATFVASGGTESASAEMFALMAVAVPEPASAALLSFAGLSLLFVHRRRR